MSEVRLSGTFVFELRKKALFCHNIHLPVQERLPGKTG